MMKTPLFCPGGVRLRICMYSGFQPSPYGQAQGLWQFRVAELNGVPPGYASAQSLACLARAKKLTFSGRWI
jgi:hypothetical protein